MIAPRPSMNFRFGGSAPDLPPRRPPLVLAPAMNVQMFEHAAVQENLARLEARGARVVPPESGELM